MGQKHTQIHTLYQFHLVLQTKCVYIPTVVTCEAQEQRCDTAKKADILSVTQFAEEYETGKERGSPVLGETQVMSPLSYTQQCGRQRAGRANHRQERHGC